MAFGRLRLLLVGATLLACAACAESASAAPAEFRVGAAVATINPTYPVYMGGYAGGPAGGTIERHINPLTGRPEDFTVRAIAIQSADGHVVEFATVDTQGYFAGYQEGPYGITDVRGAVAEYLRLRGVNDASPADIMVSAEHEHAAPTVIGIWGPPSHQLGHLKQLAAALTGVLERAYDTARPATITWGAGDAPWVADRVIAQPNAFEGWPRDGSLGALWARDARTGETIATFATEPGYPNIVFGPGDLLDAQGHPASKAVLSSDFPNYADAYIEKRLGGIALVTDGTLGNQTSAMQTDAVPSPDLPPQDGLRQTRGFDDIVHMGDLIGNLVIGALASGSAIQTPVVGAAEQYFSSPVYNPILLADDEVAPVGGGAFWAALTQNQLYATDRSFQPPYGNGSSALATWVTSFRIGDLLFSSMPGEFFPSTHAAWMRGIQGPEGNFVVGAAQDFLGYEYPVYAYPFTLEGSDEGIFNPSLTLGDQVVTAGEQNAAQLGFAADTTSSAEYTALENDYLRFLQPGVQFIPFPNRGDLAADGSGFAAVLEGMSLPPRVGAQGICVADTVTSCPVATPPMGPFRWSFGDGTGATTPPQAFARAYFSPFIHHRFCEPGTYKVAVAASDQNGNNDSMTLPITVYPPLQVAIVRSAGLADARVSGGDGAVLRYAWTIGGAGATNSAVVSAPAGKSVGVTVYDGAGGSASAAVAAVARGHHARSRHRRHTRSRGRGRHVAKARAVGASCTTSTF